MSDDNSSEKPKDDKPGVGEMALIHAVSAMTATLFFRLQAKGDSYWAAGDESLIANGIGAVFDIVYWLIKPRLLKWRNA